VFLSVFRSWNLNWNISFLESRNLVTPRRLGVGFVSRTVVQVQMEGLRTFANQDALLRQSNPWRRGDTSVCQEDTFPDCRS